MDILEFIKFAQRHRLSVKEHSFPYDEKDWASLFLEGIWRNNTVLLSDLFSKCPSEHKEYVSNCILNTVFDSTYRPIKPYSQKTLKWVFDNISFEPDKKLSSFNIVEHEREDLLEYILNHNQNNQFDTLLYHTVHNLAHDAKLPLFKNLVGKFDWNSFDSKIAESAKLSNPFLKIFNKALNKEVLDYILPYIGDDKAAFTELIKKCSNTLNDSQQIQYHAEMLDMVFIYMKSNIPSLYKDIKGELTQENSQFVYRNIFNLSIYHAKVLERHDALTNFVLYRCIETIGYRGNANLVCDSLEFLYANFKADQIDDAFSDKHKSEMFSNLIFRNQLTEASHLAKHNSHILDKDLKENISNSMLGTDYESKIEWAKTYLTIEEIDELIAKPGNKRHFEELTTWKCENFLYSHQESRVEKKKIKV